MTDNTQPLKAGDRVRVKHGDGYLSFNHDETHQSIDVGTLTKELRYKPGWWRIEFVLTGCLLSADVHTRSLKRIDKLEGSSSPAPQSE